MPIYEYRRPDGTTFEMQQSFSEDALTVDPDTGVPVERVLHPPAVHFKGKGFYNTDYGTRKRQRETRRRRGRLRQGLAFEGLLLFILRRRLVLLRRRLVLLGATPPGSSSSVLRRRRQGREGLQGVRQGQRRKTGRQQEELSVSRACGSNGIYAVSTIAHAARNKNGTPQSRKYHRYRSAQRSYNIRRPRRTLSPPGRPAASPAGVNRR